MATAAVECWSGTLDELSSIATALDNVGSASGTKIKQILVSWTDGTQQSLYDLAELASTVTSTRFSDVMTIRIEGAASNEVSAVVIARRLLPGVRIEVTGPDPSAVLGAAEMLFRRMMVGYVDRMGGILRPLSWMLVGIAPTMLVSWAVSEASASALVRILLLLLAFGGGLALFRISGPALAISEPFRLLDRTPERLTERWRDKLVTAYRYRHTRAILGVAGGIIIGIVSNKFSDAIPFP